MLHCTVCGDELPQREGRGQSPSLYCGRACQSKAYRARQAALVEAGRTQLAARSGPDHQDLPPPPGDADSQDETNATTDTGRAVVEDAAWEPTSRQALGECGEMVARQIELFVEDLEHGGDPDRALMQLRTVMPVLFARLVEQARLVRNELVDSAPADAGGELTDLARALLHRDPATLPFLRTGRAVEQLGPVDVTRPVEGPGLLPGWDLAGWTTDVSVALVCREQSVFGRVERVDGVWLAVHGSRYLQEGAGGPLMLHKDAFDAAASVALAVQALADRGSAVQEWADAQAPVPADPPA